ncbi:2-polyprenyl-3-methyl-6-methoxy-1,4-benzoquinone monooxygenase [Azoarcus taiwanensis]|uniref:3-demethoxyubiquinol 3-hydroxylase n=1 Tax=Azoarcus taiwanensis TaxID=666964 RepID=A0A972F559_9RHOO|nr:2-polyprenyl-3-methyl-6-methoxy-1,4-benzoquinone monooxygenase [Azoarcus taiwanensis]NMG01361.1 2-polyprenyl-3-methyl-6-methoxy-1,4-benzoquinone monooxygenase [Azoarcus taiwanensis]
MIDQAIIQFDRALRTLFAPAASARPTPGAEAPDLTHDEGERRTAAALMRINHCGEVCAQALYQGQAITCRSESVKRELEQASREETEHLAWTEQRIAELGGHKSLLNPIFYAGSLSLGMLAGRLGDRWNLGFLAETERQVEAHLSDHLERLPEGDARSRAILEQMREDEREHADMAVRLGAHDLPMPVKGLMRVMSRVMTATSYRI